MFKPQRKKSYYKTIALARIKILEEKIKTTADEALRKRYKELIAKIKRLYKIR